MRTVAALIVLLASQANALEFTVHREHEERPSPLQGFHVVRCAPVENPAPIPSAPVPEFNAFEAAKKPSQTDRANLRETEADKAAKEHHHAPMKSNGRKPIVFGNPWHVNGHHTDDWHLIHVHGFTAEQIRGLTPSQKDRLHGADHEGLTRRAVASNAKSPSLGRAVPMASAPRFSSGGGCPGGRCPIQRGR